MMANKTENEKKKSVDKPRQSRLIAEPHVLEGKYCNGAALSHTKREFVLDFIFQLGNEAHLVSRILTNPPHAKAILDALRRNVEQYEKKFGLISTESDDLWQGSKQTRH
jgi:hypothetical protein